MVNDRFTHLDNWDDDPENLAERYIAALLVIADFEDITPNQVHNGISVILEKAEISFNRSNPESNNKH